MPEDKKTNILGSAGSIINMAGQAAGLLGIGNKKQDRRQVNQQRELNKVNAETSMQLADYEQALKMKMWQDTNYGAQLEQAEMAGVSKAAAIGGGGAGVGQGASVDSGGNGSGAANAAATQQANINQAMAAAQINNLNADTEKKKVEAVKTAGVDTELGNVNVVGKGLDNKIAEIELQIKGQSKEAAVNMIVASAQKAMSEMVIAGKDADLKGATYNEELNALKARYAGVAIENQVMEQGIALDKARVGQIANDIMMRANELDAQYAGQKVSEDNMERLTEAMLWSAGIHATGNLVKGLVDIWKLKTPKSSKSSTWRQGPDGRESYSETITKGN